MAWQFFGTQFWRSLWQIPVTQVCFSPWGILSKQSSWCRRVFSTESLPSGRPFDSYAVPQIQLIQRRAKLRHRAEGAVGQDDAAESVGLRAAQHRQGQLPFRLIADLTRNARLLQPLGVVGPRLRKVEPGIEA